MKKNWMLMLVLALALCLVACGPKEKTPGTTEAVSTKEPASEPNATEAPKPAGFYDVGNYTLIVPEGWHAIDLHGDGCNISIYRDAETEEEMVDSVGLQIRADPLAVVMPFREDFPDAQDLDLSVLNGKPEGFTWTGWSARPMFLYEYLLGRSEHGQIYAILQGNTMSNDDTLTFSDPIVVDLLASIQFK